MVNFLCNYITFASPEALERCPFTEKLAIVQFVLLILDHVCKLHCDL